MVALNNITEKKCIICDTCFSTTSIKKTCSRKCWNKLNSIKHISKVDVTNNKNCIICNKKFETVSTRQTCSRKCWDMLNSKNRKGKGTWNKGMKGKEYLSHYDDTYPWNKGLTKETSKRIREAVKKRRYPKILVPNRKTSIEVAIEKGLIKRGINNFEMSTYILVCYPDIIFKDKKLAIFCDGDYWHTLPKVIERDKRQNRVLKENGWKVLRFWEHEINDNLESCISRVINVL